jgi:hypothetical protein
MRKQCKLIGLKLCYFYLINLKFPSDLSRYAYDSCVYFSDIYT